ncbi:MAG: acetylglutamate kinase [Dehalococcoidales bacterium]|nr:acetylglutamate kinase [Dehalococcoidales bacterium]
MDKTTVIKIGGSTFGSGDTTVSDIVALQKEGASLVVVHGGGSMITEWLKKQGVVTRFVRGERITDDASLTVAIAILAGLANKEIVAAINSSGGRAVGISGADGALVQARVKDKEMGWVGEVVQVDPAPLRILLKAGYVPIVAPVSLRMPEKNVEKPQILNVNGDLVTGEVAAALGAGRIIFLTDVAGVCDREGKLLPKLSVFEAERLIASGVASGGMIPKVKASLRALSAASSARIIDGRQPHALLEELAGRGTGTTIYK